MADGLEFGGGCVLEWARPGQRFSAERQIAVRLRAFSGPPWRLPFDVGSSPLWRGEIHRLRVRFIGCRSCQLALREVSAFGPPARVARWRTELAHRPWLVDFAGEVRSALAAIPGRPIERPLAVPENAVLRFAFGVLGNPETPVRFRVSAVPENGAAVALFSRTLAPGQASEQGWQDAAVDLSPVAGRHVALRLAVATNDETEDSFYFWAHPEVTATDSGDEPPNVVLISIDTLRADHLSLYGYPRKTSPNLDAWARVRGTVFENTVAAAPWTLPSHASLFSGLDAHRHGANYRAAAPAELSFAAEHLHRAGYSTLAVTGGGFLHPTYGFAQGFDRYQYWRLARRWKEEEGPTELSDGLSRAIDLIDSYAGRPFFLFFHTYEVHSPYHVREPYSRRFTDLDPIPEIRMQRVRPTSVSGWLGTTQVVALSDRDAAPDGPPPAHDPYQVARDLYDGGIAYTDAQLRRLLDKLDEASPRSGTLIVLTSDHGEMLGEHGVGGHKYLYDPNLLVPLIVAAPDGSGAGRIISEQVRLVDVLPTILELAGLPIPAGIDGVSLVPMITGNGAGDTASRPAWSYAARSMWGAALRLDNRLKYVFNNTPWTPVQGAEGLYRLSSDPGETENVAAITPEIARLRRGLAATFVDAFRGLRVRFRNQGETEVRGTLEGPMIKVTRVKSFDLDCPCMTWAGTHRAGFRLPPGAAYSLLLEEVEGRELIVSSSTSRSPFTVDLDHVADPLELAWDGDAWAPAGAGSEAPVTVTIAWQNASGPADTTEPATDEALERQLRALGYQ